MEWLDAIVQIFSNLGVPVGCLVASFWLLNKERIDHKEEVTELRKQHDIAESEMIKAINNNTIALEKLVSKLNG